MLHPIKHHRERQSGNIVKATALSADRGMRTGKLSREDVVQLAQLRKDLEGTPARGKALRERVLEMATARDMSPADLKALSDKIVKTRGWHEKSEGTKKMLGVKLLRGSRRRRINNAGVRLQKALKHAAKDLAKAG